ncbi:uncharacterized protein LOC127735742 [Mytilus californianus]|uniref:uncharacterized protein LOC127735742 n=1 Tax=Mytilus californianus TaxID=6549 RepID=UPI0022476202|nr:uncharacterized protein LOC127735742 [Mytilus californianus]
MERKSDEALNCCKIPIFNGQCTSWEDGPNYLPFSKKYLRSLDLFSSNGKTADITPKENEDTTNLTFRSRTNSFPQTAKTRNNKQHAISEEIDRLGLTAESVYGDKKSEIDENESNLNENNDSRFSTGYTGSKLLKDVQNVTKYSSSREDNSSKEKNAGEIRSVNIEKKLSEYGHFDILDINNIAAIPRKSSTSTALQKAKGCNRYQDTLGLFWMNEDTLPLSSPMMDRKVNACSADSGWSSDPGDPQKIRHNKRLSKKSAQNQIAGERSNVEDTKSIQVQPENEQSTIDIKKGHITKIKHSSNTIETNNSSKDQNLSNIKTFKNKTNIGSKHVTAEHHDSGEEDIHEHTSFQKQTLQWVSTSKVRQSRREHNMLSPPTF